MNDYKHGSIDIEADPLALKTLPEPRPEPGRLEADWAVVSRALEIAGKRRRQARLGALAAAASVVLVIALAALPGPEPAAPASEGTVETQRAAAGSDGSGAGPSLAAAEPGTAELIAMSQDMERELRFLRAQTGPMPSQALLYQVELQDLIGQVDDALSLSPDSRELWGQRLGLQLDLMKLYRSELRRDYLHVASL